MASTPLTDAAVCPPGPAYRLHPAVILEVRVDDRSVFGSPLTPRPDDSVRALFGSVTAYVEQHGPADLLTAAPALLAAAVASPAFAAVAHTVPAVDGTIASWQVRDEVLYPDPDVVRFSGLAVTGPDGRTLEVAVPAEDWAEVHALLAALSAADGYTAGEPIDSAPPDPRPARRHARALFDALLGAGWVRDAAETAPATSPSCAALDEPGLLFAGHNLVVIRTATTRVAVDPFLQAPVDTDDLGYRSLSWAEMGPVDAVLLTHSHPDHFAPGSLLQIDPTTTMIVPAVARETVLTVAMGERLRQLGFTDVVELAWDTDHTVGDIVVRALAFLGEQPTDAATLHPGVRNEGNTYLVRTPDVSVALLADSGRDGSGDAKDLATRMLERHGPVDVVFCGYRGWRTYPVQLLFSSVARYLLFVPPSLWGSRMRLMNDLDDVIDVAERWGARMLVPYADGGAPWFWNIGLGPRLDGDPLELEGFDPFPERVAIAAARRARLRTSGDLASPVEVKLLRPNDALVGFGTADGPHRARIPGNAWPYAEHTLPLR